MDGTTQLSHRPSAERSFFFFINYIYIHIHTYTHTYIHTYIKAAKFETKFQIKKDLNISLKFAQKSGPEFLVLSCIRRPLKTTFDMTILIFSAGGLPLVPFFLPLKGAPGTLFFRGSDRKHFQRSHH